MTQRTRLSYVFIVASIVIVAAYMRFHSLNSNPPGFFTDEAAIGYNSFKILTTGKDEYGVRLPLFFKSYGDYRLPLPIYLNIPSIILLGPTDFAVRVTSAFVGTLTVIIVMVSVWVWLGRWEGIGSGLSMAIMPWHIHMSRWGSEYVYFPFIFSSGLLFLVLFHKTQRQAYLLVGVVFLSVSMYTYYPAIIVVPLFLLFTFALLLVQSRARSKPLLPFTLSFALFFILIVPILSSLQSGELITRWNSVGGSQLDLSSQTVGRFVQLYIKHFEPRFLFVWGDQELRHAVQRYGELHLFQAVFVVLGILYILWRRRSMLSLVMVFLLMLYPVGSAITFDRLATRSVIGVIPFSVASGIGIGWFIRSIARIPSIWIRILGVTVFCSVLMLNMSTFAKALFVEYPKYAGTWDGYQYGFKQAMQYCIQHGEKYDDCLITHRFNQGAGLLRYYGVTIDCTKCALHPNPIKIDKTRKQLFFIRDKDVEEAKMIYPELTFSVVGDIVDPSGRTELKAGYFR